MSSKTSSKVKSSQPIEPTVLLAVTPDVLSNLGLATHDLRDWGRVSSLSLDVRADVAKLPSRTKNFRVLVVSEFRTVHRPLAKAKAAHSIDVSSLDELLSAEAMADQMQCTRANVYEREKKGSLFSVLPPGRENGRKYPAFQLHRSLDTALLGSLVALYKEREVQMNLLWDFLRSPQDAFAGATGVEVLVGAQPQRAQVDAMKLKAISQLSAQERRKFVMDHALEDLYHASA
jgi:hypothetical protein